VVVNITDTSDSSICNAGGVATAVELSLKLIAFLIHCDRLPSCYHKEMSPR
jgi:hypothetical protein